VTGKGLAEEIVKVWLDTPFEGGRHQKRIDKIKAWEDSTMGKQ
jgi:ribose 5-phosphate isomerase B